MRGGEVDGENVDGVLLSLGGNGVSNGNGGGDKRTFELVLSNGGGAINNGGRG